MFKSSQHFFPNLNLDEFFFTQNNGVLGGGGGGYAYINFWGFSCFRTHYRSPGK